MPLHFKGLTRFSSFWRNETLSVLKTSRGDSPSKKLLVTQTMVLSGQQPRTVLFVYCYSKRSSFCTVAPCGLWGCKNGAHSISCRKRRTNSGVDCSASVSLNSFSVSLSCSECTWHFVSFFGCQLIAWEDSSLKWPVMCRLDLDVNPLKCSGIRWLRLKLFNAIQV